MKKKIILVGGDPNSINSEIIFKSWKKLPKQVKKKIYLITNFNLFKHQLNKLKYKISLDQVKKITANENTVKLKIINVDLNFRDPFNVSNKNSSKFVIDSLNLAHKLALNKSVIGIINCPIDKTLLKRKNIGVTEFLARKCKAKKDSEIMVIKNKRLMVSPITIHLDIKSISKKISKDLIIKKIKILHFWFKKKFKKKPKIAVLGLNPHNAELKNSSEEKKFILPAIKKLKKLNIFAKGPFASDTLFIKQYKDFDIIVGMYHDQILAPFKALFKFDAITLTLGLKYLRTSPDHGVAKDRILKKNSNPESLIKCIDYLNKMDK